MDFYEVVREAAKLLQAQGRLTYRTLRRQFNLNDDALEDLKDELLFSHPVVDEGGRGLIWTGDAAPKPTPTGAPTEQPTVEPERNPVSYTPSYLAEKILTTRSALEGERKQVTVMFADIKDSTELIRDFDPEDAQQLLDPAIHIMMDAVHRFEGTVNQVLGDGIMALFGAPISHEDHSARACYAALAMQKAMQPYADEVLRTHGMAMRIRIGMNAGEVVVRTIGNDLHMDYSAVGPTTHLAARMEQIAAPGSIMLSGSTLRLVEGFVRVNALGAVPVKGMPEPVEVFELTGASTIRRRLQAAVARGLTRFVGRDTEIEAVHQALERAAAGHGQVVAAVGEAGVGKSRLVYEFIHSHRTQGWRVLESASVSYGKATPYFPVIDLLKRYAHVEEGDDTRAIRAKVTGQILTLDESLQETIPPLLSLLDALPEGSPFFQLEPPQRRQRTHAALKRILLRESQIQPLLLVFEDLHWIDSETQALLDSLIESLPTAKLLLLVNYRPEYQHSWGSKTFYTQLRLDSLPPASAHAFLQALLGDDPSLAFLKPLLIERTEGNPFFLEESVRTLIETEMLVGQAGAYRLTQELPTIQVPPTVQAVLAARIDRLPAEEKRQLQTASVIGSEVPLPLLQAIVDLSEDALQRGFAHLQAAEFLYETSLFPERIYTFKHALTQNVAYQSLLTSTRQQVHQKVAQALEEHFVDSPETQPELLAHHFTEAGLPDRAIAYWQRAGERASERSAHVEAITHLRQGLALLPALSETPELRQRELDIQIALGPALMAIKGHAAPEMERAYDRARELCQQIGDTPQLFPAFRGLMVHHMVRGQLQTSTRLGEQLLRLAQSQPEPAPLMLAHFMLGGVLFFRGEPAASRNHHIQAISIYDPQAHQALTLHYGLDIGVVSRAYLALILWHLGYPDQALQYIQEARTLAQEVSHPFSLSLVLLWAAVLHQSRNEAPAAHEQAKAAVTLAAEQGFAHWLAWGTVLHGWARAIQGQSEAAIAEIRQGLAADLATGSKLFQTYFLGLLAEAYRESGQPEEGLPLLDEALAVMDETEVRFYGAELYRLKGELLLAQGVNAHTEAETCFQQALSVARRQQAKSFELRAATSLARLWQSQGKRQEAVDLLAPVYEWFTEGFDTADLQEAKSLLDELT